MIKRTILANTACIALLSSGPAFAQDDISPAHDVMAAEIDALGGLFGEMFGAAEPLTNEQEARVPAAQTVVLKLFPEGTYAKMMDEMLAPMFDSMFGGLAGSPAIMLMDLTGLAPSQLDTVDKEKLQKAVDLLDPNAKARNAEIGKMTLDLVGGIVKQIEPSYRAGLTRAYAVRFTNEELADLDAYFATPVGSKYAAESFLIYADPQVMSSMNEMMPAMMEAMPQMMGDIAGIAGKYPQGRKFSDLSTDEQEQLVGLLGVTLEELSLNEPKDEAAMQAGDFMDETMID